MGWQKNNGYVRILSNCFSVDFHTAEEFTARFNKEDLQILFVACEREVILQERIKHSQDNFPPTGGGGFDLLDLCAPIVITVFTSQSIQYIVNSCLSGSLWDLIKFIATKIKNQFLREESKNIPLHITVHMEIDENITDVVIDASMSEEQIANCVRDAISQGLSLKSKINNQ